MIYTRLQLLEPDLASRAATVPERSPLDPLFFPPMAFDQTDIAGASLSRFDGLSPVSSL